MNYIKKIQEWYFSQCNGDWEHSYSVKISTIDNPGWAVDIYLIDTEFENIEFSPINIEYDENNWIICQVKNNVFEGFGGPLNLEDIFEIFCTKILEGNA